MISIKSDFVDFYDTYVSNFNDTSGKNIEYKRTRLYNNKVEEIKKLKQLGIKTIDIVPVSSIYVPNNQLLVVYSDITKHNGLGKVVTTYAEANMMYQNRLCSVLSPQYDGYTYKYVQVGKRRFWVIIKNTGLVESYLYSIQELESKYNSLIRLPIFSIDYTFVNGEQVAVDFNTVQSLNKINLNSVIDLKSLYKELSSMCEIKGILEFK